jgi:ribokinase
MMYMVKICSLGAASQDVFLAGKGIKSHLNPESNEYVEEFKLGAKIDVDSVVFSTGGGATNAAVTFARQGIESSFIGKLGRDMAGQAVISELDNEHVQSDDVIYSERLGTQYSTVLLADDGERTILIYRGAAHTHTAGDYENIEYNAYDWLYISSFAGAMDALNVIITKAKKAGVKVAFNPGQGELGQLKKLRPLLEDVDILIVNKEEAALIVEGIELEELARHALHYVPVVIVSDGPNGVLATDGKTIVRGGMYEDVKVIDRTGAGDAFGSGFLSQWAIGEGLKQSIIFASANSTSVVTHIGAKKGILHHTARLHAMPISESPF